MFFEDYLDRIVTNYLGHKTKTYDVYSHSDYI